MAVCEIVRRTAFAGLLIVGSTPAFADAIDGDWCSPTDAKRFRIAGADIITSAGTATTGEYSRHAFSYVVPVGDPGAGDEINMQLLNEEEVRVFVDGEAPEIWRRCQLNV